MTEAPRRPSPHAARLYRALLLAYPAAFRREHGDEAARVFAELHAEAHGPAAVARLWGRAIANVIPDGLRERFEGVTMTDLRHDLISALRQIRTHPGLAVVTVAILSLGVGAATAVLAVADGALLRPLPFPDAEAIVYVTDRQGDDRGLPPSFPEFEDWRREGRLFRAIAAFVGFTYTREGGSGAESLQAGLIGGDVMAVLGLPPLLGRPLAADDLSAGARVLMLSERYWRSRYAADAGVVGDQLVLDGETYTVVGVMPQAAEILVRRQVAVWVPLDLPEAFRARGFHLLTVVARLEPGLTPDAARPRAEALADALRATGATTHGLDLAPVRETLVGNARPLLLMLLGAVAVLLLIVAANLSNLFLARSAARAREFAVRTALGAGRFRLARQLLTECVVIGLAGGALGLAVAALGVDAVTAAAGGAGSLAPPIITDARMVFATLAIALCVALLFGLAPALRSGRSLDSTLRATDAARAGGSRSSRRHRRLLAGVELALAVVLLIGAGLLMKSLVGLLRTDVGFRTERMLTLSVNLRPVYQEGAARLAFFDDLLARVRSLPGVESASAVSHLPLAPGDTDGTFEIAGREYPEEDAPVSKKRIAAPGYFETLGIPLVRGRTFDDRDRAGGREVVVISDAIARRYWPGEDPIGREIAFGWGGGDPQEIVGIVGDVRHDGLDQAAAGAIYRPLAQFPQRGMTIVVRTAGDPLALAAAMRAQVAALDPGQPVQRLAAMDDVIRRSVTTRETMMRLLAGFAAIALVLSTLGVYAVTAHGVGQRTREIGVRMALGARSTDVLRMVLREEVALIVASLAAGLAAAWGLSGALRASLHEVSPTDPQVFAGVAVLLGLVALAATWLPARRAARVDPVSVLRGAD